MSLDDAVQPRRHQGIHRIRMWHTSWRTRCRTQLRTVSDVGMHLLYVILWLFVAFSVCICTWHANWRTRCRTQLRTVWCRYAFVRDTVITPISLERHPLVLSYRTASAILRVYVLREAEKLPDSEIPKKNWSIGRAPVVSRSIWYFGTSTLVR
jgi:hypothetical protein